MRKHCLLQLLCILTLFYQKQHQLLQQLICGIRPPRPAFVPHVHLCFCCRFTTLPSWTLFDLCWPLWAKKTPQQQQVWRCTIRVFTNNSASCSKHINFKDKNLNSSSHISQLSEELTSITHSTHQWSKCCARSVFVHQACSISSTKKFTDTIYV